MTGYDAPVQGAPNVPAAEFSVRGFTRSAHGSHRSWLNLEAYGADPLDSATLQVIDLFSRLERSALHYLRSVLVTPTHADARVTAFLVTWAYEKYWLADALELVVGANPATPGVVEDPGPAARLRRSWHALAERVEPIRESVVANLIGEDVIAVHMITAALDEWIMQTGYQRLAESSQHEELRSTLTRLLGVKHRHSAFFAAQARDRLAGAPRAQALARRRLRRTALPLGSRDEPGALMARLFGEVLGVADIAALDRRLDEYPGLAGLGLTARAAGDAARRARGRRPENTRKGNAAL